MTESRSTRPLPMRWAPPSARSWLYHRYYRQREDRWPGLFEHARLEFAPGIWMHDLVPGDVISGTIAFTGLYELGLTRRLLRTRSPGGLLVDVGANMGYFSLLWSSAVPDGRAIAYEPSPRNVELLRRNIERNRLQHRVEIRADAVGDRTGKVAFDPGPASQTGWGGLATQAAQTAIEVPMTTLDRDFASEKIDVLKIDVEGADALVIRGCARLLSEGRIRLLFFEENRERMAQLGRGPGEAKAFLNKHGYTCVPLDRSGHEWMAFLGEHP